VGLARVGLTGPRSNARWTQSLAISLVTRRSRIQSDGESIFKALVFKKEHFSHDAAQIALEKLLQGFSWFRGRLEAKFVEAAIDSMAVFD